MLVLPNEYHTISHYYPSREVKIYHSGGETKKVRSWSGHGGHIEVDATEVILEPREDGAIWVRAYRTNPPIEDQPPYNHCYIFQVKLGVIPMYQDSYKPENPEFLPSGTPHWVILSTEES